METSFADYAIWCVNVAKDPMKNCIYLPSIPRVNVHLHFQKTKKNTPFLRSHGNTHKRKHALTF